MAFDLDLADLRVVNHQQRSLLEDLLTAITALSAQLAMIAQPELPQINVEVPPVSTTELEAFLLRHQGVTSDALKDVVKLLEEWKKQALLAPRGGGGGGPGAVRVLTKDREVVDEDNPLPVVIASGASATGGLTDAELRATPVPVVGEFSATLEGGATETTLAQTRDRLPVNLDADGGVKVHLQNEPIEVTGDFATDGLTNAQLRAAPVEVTGDFASDGLTNAELRAAPVEVTGDFASDGLTDAELRATPVGVTGPLTDSQLRATAVPVALASVPSHAVTDGGGSLTVDGPITDAQLRATPIEVTGDFASDGLTDAELRATPVPISGTITANLGTIDGAATETTLAAILTELGAKLESGGEVALDAATLSALENITVALDAGTLAALESITVVDGGGSLTVDGTVGISGSVAVTGPLTDAQLRAAVVPISDGGGSLTVDGSVGLAAGTNNIGDVDVLSMPAVALDSATLTALETTELGATTLAALETTELGATTLAALESITIGTALPAGTNNIGDVDVLSLPSIPAGNNNIGDVDVASLPALPAGNNNIGDVDIASMPAVALDAASLAALETTELGATTLAALETINVTDGGGSLTVDGTFWQATQPVSVAATLATLETKPATSTLASVAASTSSVTLRASAAGRRGLIIFNDSPAILYVAFAASASASAFTYRMMPYSYHELAEPCYTGIVTGIWTAATGNARVTELT